VQRCNSISASSSTGEGERLKADTNLSLTNEPNKRGRMKCLGIKAEKIIVTVSNLRKGERAVKEILEEINSYVRPKEGRYDYH